MAEPILAVDLTVATGVGAGVLLGGRLARGRRSLAEAGHTVLDRHAGRRGEPASLEDLGSGTALERAAADAGLPADDRKVVELVAAGDPTARRVWDEVVSVLAVGARNLALLFAPEVTVLAGGVGRAGDVLRASLAAALRDAGPPAVTDQVELRTAALGDDAGLAGAAFWNDAVGKEPR